MSEEKMDAFDRKVLGDISRAGWSDIAVFPTRDHPGLPFNYTVGLTKIAHPELIIVGMANEAAHFVLGSVFKRIKSGTDCLPNTYSDSVLTKGYRVAFVEVLDMYTPDFPMNMVRVTAMPNPTALQVIWPDREDRFPWHEDFDEEFKDQQILLGPWLGES